jgi:hypothetical protein
MKSYAQCYNTVEAALKGCAGQSHQMRIPTGDPLSITIRGSQGQEYAIMDAIIINTTLEELLKIGKMRPGARPSEELIDEDRGPR